MTGPAAGGLSHFDEGGRARMVDVASKPRSRREARAEAFVRMSGKAVAALRAGAVAKGDALAVARIGGIMAAKRTSEIVPLCHPIALTSVEVELSVTDDGVAVAAVARTVERTGVEMEALVAASAAALALYDMCKSIDRSMVVEDLRLTSKRGGRSGTWARGGGDP